MELSLPSLQKQHSIDEHVSMEPLGNGLALLPQAGVAIGMALLAGQRFPELKDTILTTVLGSTVVFELLGPVVTWRVLTRIGDIRND